MSLAAFIPSEIMNEVILAKLRKQLVAVDVCSQDYAYLLNKYGDSVKIPTVETNGASTYTKGSTLTYSGLDGTSQILTIDQQKYFDYSVDLIDEAQAAANVANFVFSQASIDLAEAADTYLVQTVMPSGAGVTAGSGARALGAAGSAISVYGNATPASGALSYLGRLSQRLDEEDVPQSERWVICPPWFQSYLVQEKVLEAPSVTADDAYANGRIGRAYGFDIRVSTNLTNAKTTSSHILAGHKSAIQFAGNLVDSKIIDLETKFATGVRGLYVYGAKCTRSNAIALGVISQA